MRVEFEDATDVQSQQSRGEVWSPQYRMQHPAEGHSVDGQASTNTLIGVQYQAQTQNS